MVAESPICMEQVPCGVGRLPAELVGGQMKSDPAVSVLMPVYNGDRYLGEAIESILNQSFTDFEYIIVEDGSSDNTPSILKDYAAQDSRIVLINNEQNLGLPKSLNKGLSYARGRYVARMDADDISLPERLKTQIEFMEKHPNIGALGTAVRRIDSEGRPIKTMVLPTHHGVILWRLCFGTPFVHPTMLIRRELLTKVNGYDVDFANAQDRELWQRLSAASRLANLPDVHLLYRDHLEGVSKKHAERRRHFSARAGQRLITRLLGYEVPYEVCYALRRGRFEQKDILRQAISLVNELYNVFMEMDFLSTEERRLIRLNAARRLMQIVRVANMNALVLPETFSLLRDLNPLLVSASFCRKYLVPERLSF